MRSGTLSSEPVSLRVAQFNLNRIFHSDSNKTYLGIQRDNLPGRNEIDRITPRKCEPVCWIPDYLVWDQQAQVGGTHLFLASTDQEMIVIKVPEDI